MKTFFSCAAMLAMIALAWSAHGATPVKKKAPVKKGTPTATSGKKKSLPARRPVSASTPGSASKRGKKAPVKHAATWRTRQLAPSTDRYREIQQALADKGYLKPEEATGAWNANSTDALKKFQTEQNLDASGKINSLSLIALGLGPKHDSAAVAPPPKPAQEADQTGR